MLELKDLTKTYGELVVVQGVNLRIEKGEFFGLLGPNGAGKTTTIKMISTLTPKTKGKITIDGQVMERDVTSIKRKIGIVHQQNNLEVELTALENLRLHGMLYRMPKSEREIVIERLLDFTELTSKKDVIVNTFSGGMKRRMMIAKALMHSPEILLLDEPTVGLDAGARRKIWDLLKSLKEQGLTVLLTTHYIEEAQYLCDRVGLIDQGKLIEVDTPQNLIRNVGEFVVEYFYQGETHSQFFEDESEAKEYVAKLSGNINIRKANLEDVFLKLANRKVES